MNHNNKVAIIGIGLRLPGKSNSPNEFWSNLVNKFDGVVQTPPDRFSNNFHDLGYFGSDRGGFLDLDEWFSFDPLFFGIAPSDAAGIDPQQRMLLKVTYEALEDANIKPNDIRGTNTSVFVGSCSTDYRSQLFNGDKGLLQQEATPYSLANRLSHTFDFRGASITIDTACSSSINAFTLGCNSIEHGNSGISIVGGVGFIFNSYYFNTLTNLKTISPDGICKVFDADANGFVRAEGCCVLILKNLERAIADGDPIYSVVEGVNSNSDGNFVKENLYSPSSHAQAENINCALEKGNIKASDVYYFECHGTGTSVGDKAEASALSLAFKDNHSQDQPLYIGSVKSNIGHTEGTSGVCSIVKSCLMIKHRTLVPSIHFNTPNPNIDFNNWHLKVVTECSPFPNDKNVIIGINSFGITGSNGCVFLSEYKNPVNQIKNNNNNNNVLIPLSSPSKLSIDRYQSMIMDPNYIENIKDKIEFSDFVKLHILSKPTNYSQRLVINSNSQWDQLPQAIVDRKEDETISNMINIQNNPNIVFVYCGQGSQWNKMGSDLYKNEPIFKQTIDIIDNELSNNFGYSIWSKLQETTDESSIHDPFLAQPSMFLLQCALTELYKQWGVNPDIVTGHSFGEITSLFYSGKLSMKSACKVVYERARLQHKTVGSGRMLVVSISKDEFDSRIKPSYPDIEIACFNSHNSIVLSGDTQKLEQIKSSLDNVFTAFLGTQSSFHSSSQESIKNELFESISNELFYTSDNNQKPIMFSTTTSEQTNQYSTELLFNNLRNPVLFEQTLNNINSYLINSNNSQNTIFIEIAPHPTLFRNIKDYYEVNNNNNNKVLIFSPLNKKSKETEEQLFKNIISKLYINGYNIDFTCQFSNQQIQDQSFKFKCQNLIPHYQWDDQIYYKEDESMKILRLQGPPINCLGNPVLFDQIQNSKTFKSIINTSLEPFAFLKGHQVGTKNYFPGCGFIDNIIKAFPTTNNLLISRLDFKIPFVLKSNTEYQLHTSITQVSKNEYKVDFNFYDNNQWNNAATGKIIISPPFKNEKLDFQTIKSSCGLTTMNKSEIYPVINSIGDLIYVDHFSRVEQLFVGNNCSLSKVAMKPRVSKTDINSFFNPAILDACLHGAFPLIKGPLKIVFDRISNLKLHRENFSNINIQDIDYIYAYTHNLKVDKVDNRISFSLIVMIDDGTVLYEINHVICASLTPIKNSDIKYPTKELFSAYWQQKDSIIEIGWIDNHLKSLKGNEFPDHLSYQIFCTMIFYNQIKKKAPPALTKSEIIKHSVYKLMKKYLDPNVRAKYTNLFRSSFKLLKEKPEYMIDDQDQVNNILSTLVFKDPYIKYTEPLKKSIRVIASLLFPSSEMEFEDTQQYLFEGDLMESIYNDNGYLVENMELISTAICKSIHENREKRGIVRILELGSGTGSLSIMIIKSLYRLLDDKNKLEIEFTFSDVVSSFIPQAKQSLKQYSDKINIIYTTVDIESDFLDKQKLKGSYYDFVVMSNVMHVAGEISFPLQEIYKILSYGGHLMFLETSRGYTQYDFFFGAFDQWTTYKDSYLRTDHCLLTTNQWIDLLQQKGYVNATTSSPDNHQFIVYGQKPCINDKEPHYTKNNKIYKNVFILDNIQSDQFGLKKKLINYHQNYGTVTVFSSFDKFIENINIIQDDDLIFNLSTLSKLDQSNFIQSTMEYIQINQEILKNKKRCGHILISLNSTMNSQYYLNSSVVGAVRYFKQYNNCVLLDFDQSTLDNQSIDIINLVEKLIDTKSNYYREYSIRNGIPYYETLGRDTTNYSNSSFEDTSFHAKFKPNLNLQLTPKPKKLESDQVEIQMKASGINFRDNLVYRGLVSPQFTLFNEDIHNLGFGGDNCGIISSVGDNVTKLKVGDKVCGLFGEFGSHVIANQNEVCKIPDSISCVEAASIPVIYITVYSAILRLGGLFEQFDCEEESTKSILIHSATGGVGLAALNLLKWKMNQKEIKVHIFVTVSTKEKENFIKELYGDMISGVYSSLNSEFVDQIKSKLIELKSNRGGVDMILNTFGSEFMHSNFSTLAQDGRIVDLSVTHLYNHEFLDFNNFRHNISYITTDVSLYSTSYKRNVLNQILDAISKKELDLIPITVFPVDKIKDALEFIGQRKHIGKLVVDFDKDIITKDVISKNKNKVLKENYSIKSDIKCLLITGQQGMVLEVLKWLLINSKTITNVIILTRSSMKWDMERTINQYKSKINFYFKMVDVGNYNEMESTIKQLYDSNEQLPPVDSIIHFAYLHTESEPLDIAKDELTKVHNVKSMGLINLHDISLLFKWNINNFIISSSSIIYLTSPNQCAYISANLVYDSFAKYRRSLGLPCNGVYFGSIEGAGYVSRNKSVEQYLSFAGVLPTSLSKILGGIDLILNNNSFGIGDLMIGNFNFEAMKNSGQESVFFDNFTNIYNGSQQQNTSSTTATTIRDKVISSISDSLEINSSKLNVSSMKLKDYGVDSLFMVQLKNWIEKEFGKPNIITIPQLQNSTIDTIINIIEKDLKK